MLKWNPFKKNSNKMQTTQSRISNYQMESNYIWNIFNIKLLFWAFIQWIYESKCFEYVSSWNYWSVIWCISWWDISPPGCPCKVGSLGRNSRRSVPSPGWKIDDYSFIRVIISVVIMKRSYEQQLRSVSILEPTIDDGSVSSFKIRFFNKRT